ncbi:M23 family peptidase, partial [Streptomyces sp. SP18CM02]|nr:M23 family peptidase [Streptomyces sp. SP18CM02]
MASNQPAPEAVSPFTADADGGAERSVGEWYPSEDTIRPVRVRHREATQRGHARRSTVLGVGVLAGVGAGGLATGLEKGPVSISLPDSIAVIL